MTKKNADQLTKTKRLVGALVRMKPKPHDEMKVRAKRPAKKSKVAAAK